MFLVSISKFENAYGNICWKLYYENKDGKNTSGGLTKKYQKMGICLQTGPLFSWSNNDVDN